MGNVPGQSQPPGSQPARRTRHHNPLLAMATCTRPSTITSAWPAPRSCPTRSRRPLPRFWPAQPPGTPSPEPDFTHKTPVEVAEVVAHLEPLVPQARHLVAVPWPRGISAILPPAITADRVSFRALEDRSLAAFAGTQPPAGQPGWRKKTLHLGSIAGTSHLLRIRVSCPVPLENRIGEVTCESSWVRRHACTR